MNTVDTTAHSITLAFALITLATAIVLFALPIPKFVKEKNFEKIIFKEKKVFYIVSYICLLASMILFAVQFYTNPENIDYIENTLESHVDGLHSFMIYGGAVLLSLGIFAVAVLFVQYFYFNLKEPKEKKKLFWTLIGSAVLCAIFLIVFIEGNAPYLRYPLANRIYIGSSGIRLVTVNLGYNWRPVPTGDSWGFNVAIYAFCILGGGITVFLIDSYKMKILYGEKGLLTNVFLIGFPTGIIGCRIWYVIGNWERDGFNKNPLRIFAINEGGLAIMGASLGVICGVAYLLVLKYKMKKAPYTKMNYLTVIDVCVASMLFAQCIGRWGNFFNNEVHGNLVDQSSWNWLPVFIKNNMHFSSSDSNGKAYSITSALSLMNSGKIYVPLFLIEGITNTIGFFAIEHGIRLGFKKLALPRESENKKWYNNVFHFLGCDGACLGWYFIWYGATRAILEPKRFSGYNMGNNNQWSYYSAFGMMGIGVLIIILFAVWQYYRDHGKLVLKVKEED